LKKPGTGTLHRSGSVAEKPATKITGFPQKVKQKMPWKKVNTDGTRATNQMQSLGRNQKKFEKMNENKPANGQCSSGTWGFRPT